ncbi:M48 family metalloprotease [bacterium]|nr:M48 family metalloprotease [bacterium]
MSHVWEQYRYRGDAADVQTLFDTYRIQDYLEVYEENARRHDQGVREQLMTHGIRLNEKLSPRIYRLYHEVCDALEIAGDAEVFCLPDTDVNAFAILDVRKEGTLTLIGVTSGALEQLDDAELKSILGHEFGHFLYGHNRMNALLTSDEDNPAMTVLPPFGESLFLRWRKKAEISCDRAGLLACGDFHASARALLKATFGLTEKNLNLDVDSLVAQVDEIRTSPELIESTFASHPLLPIRLKALELFARSDLAGECGCRLEGPSHPLPVVDDQVDELITLTRRHPVKPLSKAVMDVIALGGAQVMGADAHVGEEEVRLLVQTLHGLFTDEPESVIVTDRDEIEKRLPEACAVIRKEGGEQEKGFVISRLAALAFADGALMESENTAILKVAELLEFPPDAAYRIIVGAAQAGGMRVDATLNRIVTDLQRSFRKRPPGEGRGVPPLWR